MAMIAWSEMTSSNKSKSRNAKISLEEYLRFVDSQNHSDFSINCLNQIIAMHGYKKIHKTLKVVVSSAMSSIEVVNPRRSTLSENICPWESEARLESIVEDLKELNWQECSIASVEAISAVNQSSVSSAAASAKAVPQKRLRREPKEETNRRALKPKENSATGEGKRSNRAAKLKKKNCLCTGCVSHGPCSFVW